MIKDALLLRYNHSWQRVPNPYILLRPTILPTLTFFKFCPTPSPTSTPLLFLLHCFFGWMGDSATFAALFYVMILLINTCRALVPKYQNDLVMWFMFYARRQVYWDLTHYVFLLAPWFDMTHTYKDTKDAHGANTVPHSYK